MSDRHRLRLADRSITFYDRQGVIGTFSIHRLKNRLKKSNGFSGPFHNDRAEAKPLLAEKIRLLEGQADRNCVVSRTMSIDLFCCKAV